MVERRGDGNGKFRMGTKYTVEESKGPISKMDFEQIWSSETLTRNMCSFTGSRTAITNRIPCFE